MVQAPSRIRTRSPVRHPGLAARVAGEGRTSRERIPTADLEAKKADLLADEATQKKPEAIRPQIVEVSSG